MPRRQRRGQRPPYPQLIGGPKGDVDFATDPKIPRTIGNYWPYATTVFDYVRRAMPLTAPGSLIADQTYAVTAYLLSREGVIPDTRRLDARSLAGDPDAGQARASSRTTARAPQAEKTSDKSAKARCRCTLP